MSLPLRIFSPAEELDQGLFGMIFYHAFQLLPYLHERGIYPAWDLRSLHYGDRPNSLTIPGVLELAYTPPEGPYRTLTLVELRRRHAHTLGNDWKELNRLWNAYFRIPERVEKMADKVFPQGRVLGLHYRGTDKQTTSWDSNPISQDEYLTLARDFLDSRGGDFDVIFAATDEFSFVERLRSMTSMPVISLGQVDFHLATEITVSRRDKADRAVLDCVLLSRCNCVIETSSALPSFAKLFNPELEIYRTAASKLFGKLFTKMPYFPVAHIPVLPAKGPAAVEILRRTMESDWTESEEMARFKKTFTFEPRFPINHRVFSVADKLKLGRVAGRLLPGYR